MSTRRAFLKSAVLASAASAIETSATVVKALPQRILVLGGTIFLGPAIVERALAAGHQVTLFNRGKTNPEMFPKLEKMRGDREDVAGGGLAALNGSRHWDAVIDVWPAEPEVVIPTAKLLKGRTKFYSFVSSIGAYTKLTQPGANETQILRAADQGYGGNKARSELQLTELMGADRLGIVRPCAISGPRDPSLSFHYWLARLQRDHRIVAPGDGTSPIELVDVRDVADWVVSNVEARRAGPYDTCAQPIPFNSFLSDCRTAIGGKATIVWIDRGFLEKQGVGVHNGNMPFWNPDDPHFEQVSSDKARSQGWRTRPLAATARDAWNSYIQRVSPSLTYPQHQWTYDWGISEDREAQILNMWDTQHVAS